MEDIEQRCEFAKCSQEIQEISAIRHQWYHEL